MNQNLNARQYNPRIAAKYQEVIKPPVIQIQLTRRWQFKPRTIRPFLAWGFALFLTARLLIIPLAEGVYSYVVKTQEIKDFKNQYEMMKQKITEMTKTRDYMKSPAYIEERGHQIGMIKSNESKMVVVDSPDGVEIKTKPKKRVEIGD
jgi:cell division protein FtsB